MVNASLINRLSQAADEIEKRLKQNRPWRIVKVRRGYDEDGNVALDRHFSAHPEDQGTNVVLFEFYEDDDGPARASREEPVVTSFATNSSPRR